MKLATVCKLAVLGSLTLAAAGTPAGAQHAFDGNIFFDNSPDNGRPGGSATFDAVGLIGFFPHNDLNVDPQLTDPLNLANPNWVPLAASPASFRNDDVVEAVDHGADCDNCANVPAFAQIDRVCYRGALAPAGSNLGGDWTQGWTYYNFDGTGRADINYSKPLQIFGGNTDSIITGNTTWTPSQNYLLRGRVRVVAPGVLTIRAGTVIFGEKATTGFLMVDRGAQIRIQGDANFPVILTSDQAPGLMAPGDNGGLVINGRAIANCADCLNGASCISEGTQAEHCGSDDCDGSGSLQYFRVEYAGKVIVEGNELNAFTFNSCGVNTRAEYLQAFRGSDDLFEWFGGKMTARYLVGCGGQDDGLDWQMGFRGKIQFAVIQMYSDGNDKGIEADNNEFDFNAPCRSNPIVANVTLINNRGSSGPGIHFRRGTDAHVYNSIIMGWRSYGLRVEHNETSARGFYPVPPVTCGPASVDAVAEGRVDVKTFPNPVVNEAHFFVNLPQAGSASLDVFNADGRRVASLLDGDLSAGAHQAVWNLGSDVASGTYFYQARLNGRVTSGRVVAIR